MLIQRQPKHKEEVTQTEGDEMNEKQRDTKRGSNGQNPETEANRQMKNPENKDMDKQHDLDKGAQLSSEKPKANTSEIVKIIQAAKLNSESSFPSLDEIRLSQDFAEMTKVERQIVSVPVRRPHKHEFVRVHPDEDYRIDAAIFEDKKQRESFLILRSLWPELENDITRVRLFTAITRSAAVILWPVKHSSEGQHNEWNHSAMEAAKKATQEWVRVQSNMQVGAYDVHGAQGDIPEPEWPPISFEELLRIAFKDRVIDSRDHILLRKLRGEI